MKNQSSFTLIELLIVIGVLAVLATVAVLALNPLELIKQARDSQRMADLGTLNKALAVYQSSGQTNLGTVNTVYVSIPKNVAADCSDLGLPILPSGWTYGCVASSTLRNSNGTGWIPLNFSLVSYGTPLEKLPVDPINSTTTRNYYTYTPGGSWEFTTAMESAKYKMGGGSDKTSKDGGQYPGLYEEGTNLSLLPIDYGDSSLVGYWKFDEGSGSIAYDASGNNATGTWSGSGTHYTSGKIGSYAGQFNGTDDSISVPDSNKFTSTDITISSWINVVGSFSSYNPIFYHRQDGNNRIDIGVMNGGFYCTFSNGTSYNPSYYNAALNSGTGWIMWTCQWNGSTVKYYLNGVNVNNESFSGTLPNINANLQIGSRLASSQYFNGLIDDVRVYNRALSAAEVSAIYNATK
ncbi:MAG: prepilin-type N-terminal cleavage/methylation domain-containing protein [Candidatus Wolfebacteria bacterium]|nr:prepilin-type N-terminal cleavage/methylation domain-containing protein [Candidatus Wolfebacteria bacterium]